MYVSTLVPNVGFSRENTGYTVQTVKEITPRKKIRKYA